MNKGKCSSRVFFILVSAFLWFLSVPVFAQSPPTLDGLIDNVYYSHGYSVSYKGFYLGAEATLHVLDNATIDNTYVWICWEIATTFNDNSYNTYKHSTWGSTGHIFGDLTESDMQRLDLENTCGELVLDAMMDYIESGYATPSGYSTGKDSVEFPLPGAEPSNYISTGNWAHLEFDTSLSANLNDFGYCTGGTCDSGTVDLLVDSPPWSDEPNFIPSAEYSNWEYHLIWELRVDRQVFQTATCPTGTILGVATNPIELHASPSKSVSPVTVFPAPGSIGDYIWLDTNKDGVQDVTERGLANVTVDLYTDPNGDGDPSDGSVIATTTTDAEGRYLFSLLGAGNYVVDVTDTNGILTGFSLTTGSTDPHGPISLDSEEDYLDADFGYAPTSAIGDYVWSDADNDGMQDPGEPGIGGVTIQLLADNDGDGNFTDVVATTTTKDDGSYFFTGLSPDDYKVDVTDTGGVLTGYTLTVGPQSSSDPTDIINIEAGEVYLNADFGYYQAGLGSIGNQIWFEDDADGLFETGEVGIFNVTVDLIKDTNGNGIWDAGEFVISSITAEDGTYQFNGLSLDDGDGDADYLIHITDVFNVLRRYRKSTGASPGSNNNSQTDPYAVALSSGSPSNQTADFGFYFDRYEGLVGDFVWYDLDGDGVQDAGEPGIEGVTVSLQYKQGSNWRDAGSVVTDANGFYYFPNLDTGGGGKTYRTVVTDGAGTPLEGYTHTNPDPALPALTQESNKLTDAAPQDLSLDFGFSLVGAAYSIGDYIWLDGDGDGVQDAGESGFENVTVSLYEDLDGDGVIDPDEPVIATDYTDALGNYLFSNLANGDYIVKVTDNFGVLNGYTKTYGTDNWPVTISGASNLDIDYGYFREDPTLAFIAPFHAYSEGGRVVVHWETTLENGTAGFNLYRWDQAAGKYRQVNEKFLPGLLNTTRGGIYRFVDDYANAGGTYTYMLEEVEAKGGKRSYGPFTVKVGIKEIDYTRPALEPLRGRYGKQPHPVSPERKARQQARLHALNAVRLQQKAKVADEIKITVKEKGLYYLDAAEIANALGIPVERAQKKIGNLNYQLTNRGLPAAYIPAKGDTGLYFYGEDIDSIYTDKNIFRLKKSKGLQMQFVNGGSPAPASGDETFNDTLHLEQDNYALTAIYNDPESDYWLWDFVKGGESGKAFNFYAHGAASFGTAVLKVYLKGATNTAADPDHHVKVSLNGTFIGESQWDGIEAHDFDIYFDQSLLNDGGNTIEVTAVLSGGVPYSIFHVDSFDLDYKRFYRAVNGRLLCRGDSNPVITVEGFTNPDIRVFDVTDPLQPQLVTGVSIDAANRASFMPAAAENLYLVLNLNGLYTPLSVVADKPSKLKKQRNSADYVVIAGEGLEAAAEDLANLRQGRGLETMVVEIEDIFDEFNYGISSPYAVKDFLSYAYHNWKNGGPAYVVLAGEGTFDYKNNMGHGGCLVPPLMVNTPFGLFASDNRFGDVSGEDGVPEIAIGRLPVLTNQELRSYIDKLIDYENTAGEWTGRVMMLADDPDYGGNFTTDSDYLASLLPLYQINKTYLPDFPTAEAARQKVIDDFNAGALIVNYIGHAGLDRLAKEGLFRSEDVSSLQNEDRLPVVTAFTCVVGRFAVPGYDTLSELLLIKSSGGAAAVWAPSGASLNTLARRLAKELFTTISQGQEKVLGSAVIKALQGYAFYNNPPFMQDIYNLLGDPALEIK